MKKRLWQFDYMKTAAILMVVIVHSIETKEVYSHPIFPYLMLQAVTIFMVISGYMNAKSYEKHNLSRIRDWYSRDNFLKKVMQIAIPYVFIFLCEWVSWVFFFPRYVGIKEFIYALLTGGWGPGGYYVLILIQLLLFFPFFYSLLKRMPKRGSLIVLGTQLVLEIGVQYFSVPESLYRLLFIRYFVVVWFGIILYLYGERIRGILIPIMGVLGFAYIWLITYTEYQVRLFRYWTGTSMPTILWIGMLVVLGKKYFRKLPGVLHCVVTIIGHATYYIFLVQMVYFAFPWQMPREPQYVKTIVSLLCCLGIGIAFWWIYEKGRAGLKNICGRRKSVL